MKAIERLRERAQNEATCIELSRQNKELRARFANWQDDINAVLEQRNDLHARVARLEEIAVHVYNSGYRAGHNDTVECCYIDIPGK